MRSCQSTTVKECKPSLVYLLKKDIQLKAKKSAASVEHGRFYSATPKSHLDIVLVKCTSLPSRSIAPSQLPPSKMKHSLTQSHSIFSWVNLTHTAGSPRIGGTFWMSYNLWTSEVLDLLRNGIAVLLPISSWMNGRLVTEFIITIEFWCWSVERGLWVHLKELIDLSLNSERIKLEMLLSMNSSDRSASSV